MVFHSFANLGLDIHVGDPVVVATPSEVAVADKSPQQNNTSSFCVLQLYRQHIPEH